MGEEELLTQEEIWAMQLRSAKRESWTTFSRWLTVGIRVLPQLTHEPSSSLSSRRKERLERPKLAKITRGSKRRSRGEKWSVSWKKSSLNRRKTRRIELIAPKWRRLTRDSKTSKIS